MTPEGKLEQARAALLGFESANPRAKEDLREAAEAWIADARHVVALDVTAAVSGGLQREHLASVIDAFTVASPAFRDWLLAQVNDVGLISRKQRDGELKRLQKAVRDADAAVARAGLEAEKRAVEERLAALGA
jgi:hypothetical protein